MVIESDADSDLFATTSVLTVHLDAGGRVREISSSNDTFGSSRTEFFGFDEAIAIEIPSDATDKTAAFGAAFDPLAVPTSDATVATPTPPPARTEPTLLDLIDAQPELSTFRALIAEAPGAEAMLDLPNPDPWTVFAPTNDALARSGALDALREQPLVLRGFVFQHIVKGAYDQAALIEAGSIQSFEGWPLDISSTNGGIEITSRGQVAPLLVGDATAVDGVMHVVTGVLDPALAQP